MKKITNKMKEIEHSTLSTYFNQKTPKRGCHNCDYLIHCYGPNYGACGLGSHEVSEFGMCINYKRR